LDFAIDYSLIKAPGRKPVIHRACLTAVLLLTALISVVSADTGVNVVVEHRYYSVRGDTAQELRQQLDTHGVAEADGKRYDAITHWDVTWHLHYKTCEGGCAIESVGTTVHVVMTLPRWEDFSNGPWALQDEWNRYMRALLEHETGHQEHAVMAAREIEQAISRLDPCGTPREIETQAHGLASEILEKYVVIEREYDARTSHGLAQGATFPHERYYAQCSSGDESKPKRPKLCHFLITTSLRP